MSPTSTGEIALYSTKNPLRYSVAKRALKDCLLSRDHYRRIPFLEIDAEDKRTDWAKTIGWDATMVLESPAERDFFYQLNKYILGSGAVLRTQVQLLNYRVDALLSLKSRKVIIEVDGNHHREEEFLHRDRVRDERLLSEAGINAIYRLPALLAFAAPCEACLDFSYLEPLMVIEKRKENLEVLAANIDTDGLSPFELRARLRLAENGYAFSVRGKQGGRRPKHMYSRLQNEREAMLQALEV